jgi:CheY-like chemotaxis protein
MNRNIRLLLIDDTAYEIEYLLRPLIRTGYLIRIEANGKDALKALEREKFDLILLDLIMRRSKHGEDYEGMHILKLIRNNHIDIPIVILSVVGESVDFSKTFEDLGVAEIINKGRLTGSILRSRLDSVIMRLGLQEEDQL